MERPVHAFDMEDGPGARRWMHGRPQASGMGTALLFAPRRPDRGGRGSGGGLQRRAGHRRGGRRRPGVERAPAPRELHRLLGDRAARGNRGRRTPGAGHGRAGWKGPTRRLRRRRPRRRRPEGSVAVRRLGPELHGGHAAPRGGRSGRGIPAALPPGRRRACARRPTRGDDDDLATHPPRPSRAGKGVRRAGARARGGSRARRARPGHRGALLRANARRAQIQRLRDRPAGGVRPGADIPDLRERGRSCRAGELDRVRACGDRLHLVERAREARRPGGPGRHGLGERVSRPRPDGAFRRGRRLGHRPRRRRLRARLLFRPEDAPGPRGLDPMTVVDSGLGLDDVNLENDVFADRVPHETFALLRREAPVWWYDWPHGRGYWCVTKHADVVAVSRDTKTFTSEHGPNLEDLDEEQRVVRQSMLETDPPRHTRLRGLVGPPFTPRAIKAYELALRELTADVLDRALPLGEIDFIEEVAKQLPIRVLARLL